MKVEERTDDNDSICPYCGESYQVEGEDYSEDSQEIECGECGKKYWLQTTFSISHTSTPDCELNGEEHQYLLNEAGTAYFCSVCEKCKLADSK